MIYGKMRPKRALLLMTLAALLFILSSPAGAGGPTDTDAESLNMTFVGQYDEGYIGNELYLQPAYAIVGEDGGVSLLRINSPGSLSKLAHRDMLQGFPEDITADGGLIYAVVGRPIGLGGDYLEVMVREDGDQTIESLGRYFPPPVQGFPITGITSIDKQFSPDYVYLGATTGLIVVDMFSKENGIYNAAGFLETAVVRDLVVDGNFAYLATDEGLDVVSIGSPTSPSLVGSVTLDGRPSAVAVGNGHAFVAVGYRLHIIKTTGGAEPKEVNTLVLAGDNVRDVAVEGAFLYLAKGSGGVQVWYIGNPADPEMVGMYDDPGFGASGVEVFNRYVYVSAGGEGIKVLQNTAPQPAMQANAVTPGVSLNGGALTPGTAHPFGDQDSLTLAGGARVQLTGDCVQDIVLLLLAAEDGDPLELIPTLLANHPDLCAAQAAASANSGPALSAASSAIHLTLTGGSVQVSPQFESLFVEIATANALIVANGFSHFTVSYAAAITTVKALSGAVEVSLADGSQPPIILPPGFAAQVTDDGFGEVESWLESVYLPVMSR